MQNKKIPTFSTFPMKILTAALLVTIALFLSTAWHFWKSFQDYQKGPSQEYKYQFLLSSINSGTEMTALARQIVNNRSLGPVSEYNRLSREVDKAISELIQIAPDKELLQIAQNLDNANKELVRLEAQSFEFAQKGLWNEARNSLYSEEYRKYLNLFDKNNQALDRDLRKKVEDKIAQLKRRAYIGITAAAAALPILLFVWIFVLTLVRKHMRERVHQEWLNMTFASLEQKLSVISSPREAAQVIFDSADELFGWDACFLNIYNSDTKSLEEIITIDTINGQRQQVEPAYRGGNLSPMMRQNIERGAQLILRDVPETANDNQLVPFGDKHRRSASLMFAPLRKGSQIVGVLSIQSYKRNAYSRKDLNLLQILVDRCGGALDRTIAESKLRESEENLRKAHADLEKRVEERTRDLSIANELLQRQIRERQKAQEALALSEKIYREAIENASGVPYRLIYDKNDYDFVGQGVKALLGCEPHEFNFSYLRSLIKEIIILDPAAPQEHSRYVEDFRQGRIEQYRVDLRVSLPSGVEKWISDCSVPLRDAATGGHIGSLGILQDITLRKKAEEQARIHQEQLIQTDKMASLGILVSGMAHEINNPNNFIMLNAPILKEFWQGVKPILDQYYRENGDFIVGGLNYSEMAENFPLLVSGILEGSIRIKNIVQELRDFSRQDAGVFQDNVDINAVAQSALTLVSSMIKESTESFSLKLGENIPPVRGNFQRLEQVLLNLIQNACQALPDKNRAIEVSTSYHIPSQSVCVRVRDGGVGIPKDTMKHIMDPFFTTKREQGGIGLGLSISLNIVKQHGGDLHFDSQPGRGTVAILTLPVNSKG